MEVGKVMAVVHCRMHVMIRERHRREEKEAVVVVEDRRSGVEKRGRAVVEVVMMAVVGRAWLCMPKETTLPAAGAAAAIARSIAFSLCPAHAKLPMVVQLSLHIRVTEVKHFRSFKDLAICKPANTSNCISFLIIWLISTTLRRDPCIHGTLTRL